MSKIQRLELPDNPENLETIQIGKSWLLEAHFDPDKGVVASVTRQSSAVTASTWRSPDNWTGYVFSNFEDWQSIPLSIQGIARDMLARNEKSLAKAGLNGYYFPAGCRLAFRRKSPTECAPA